MARIQLRDTDIYIQDGLAGSAAVNEVTGALASPSVTTVDGVAATSDEVVTLVQYAVNFSGGTFTLTFNLDGESAFTTLPIAYNAGAAAIESAIDAAATLAGVAGWTNGDISVAAETTNLTDGDITLTFDGTSVTDTNHGPTTLNGAGLTSSTLNGATNLDIDTVVLNTDDTDLVPVGARFTVAGDGSTVHTVTGRTGNPTTNIVFTPALGSAGTVFNNAVITFLPQRITVKIGDGDLSWTESREFIYDLDRDLLDTVREGQEQPVEVEMAFIFDYVTTESGQSITPVDALKRIGEATEWVSSSSDLCEPYAVDIYVLHCVPCGTDEDQDFLFQDFRWESLEYSIQDASIAVSGRCNVSNVVTTRADHC